MSNVFYEKTKDKLLKGEINFLSETIKVALVTSDYIPSYSSDEFLSDINPSWIKATGGPLENVNVLHGVLDADDLIINDYSGDSFSSIVFYCEKETPSESTLIGIITDSLGLPFISFGFGIDLLFSWKANDNRILAII